MRSGRDDRRGLAARTSDTCRPVLAGEQNKWRRPRRRPRGDAHDVVSVTDARAIAARKDALVPSGGRVRLDQRIRLLPAF